MAGFANDVVYANNADFSTAGSNKGQLANGILTDGQLWIGRTAVNAGGTHIDVNTLTAGTGMTITNGPGTITLATTASLTDLHVARFIVASSTVGTGANFTSITAAIASAVGTGIPSTIALQPGTYTENFIWPENINICAFSCDPFTPNVTIIGTVTCTSAGTRSMSGIRLQTNGAALLAITGSAATNVNLQNCYLNCTNFTGITFSSSGSPTLDIANSKGNLGTTGIALFAHSSNGTLTIKNFRFTNTGGSSTASTCSSGVCDINNSKINNPITFSSTAAGTFTDLLIDTSAQNVTAFTAGGSGAQFSRYCTYISGSATAVSISGTANMDYCQVDSTNTNAITGGGVLVGNTIVFLNTSSLINTTTKTLQPFGLTGTWLPNLQINGSSTGITYGVQNGTYTQIGNVVFIWGIITLTSKGAGTGNISISNLPIAVGTSIGKEIPIPYFNQFTSAGVTSLALQLGASTTVGTIISSGSGVAAAATSSTTITNTFEMRFAGMYLVD